MVMEAIDVHVDVMLVIRRSTPILASWYNVHTHEDLLSTTRSELYNIFRPQCSSGLLFLAPPTTSVISHVHNNSPCTHNIHVAV